MRSKIIELGGEVRFGCKCTDFVIEEVEREWDPKKLEAVKANQNQLDLLSKKKFLRW